MTQESVNAELVSKEEQVLETTETTEKVDGKVEPQPLTEERVLQMLAERESQAKEAGRREMQGIKDREVAEARRIARLAEGRVKSYETSFNSLDDETRERAELARYREQDKIYQSQAQEEVVRQREESLARQGEEALIEEIKAFGINPDDTRIDYAKDITSDVPNFYVEGRRRFASSLSKILSEDRKVAESELEKRLTAKIEETITQKALDAGLESHDASDSSGISGDEDAFMVKMADPNHVTTKEDLKRIDQIQKKIGG